MQRPDGYYWINCPDQDGWQIAEYATGYWQLCGSEVPVVEGNGWSEVTQVGSRVLSFTDDEWDLIESVLRQSSSVSRRELANRIRVR